IKHIFNNAKSTIIIHSTFIDDKKLLYFLPHIRQAVNRGVKIHILWGQNEQSGQVSSTNIAIQNLISNEDILSLGEQFHIHPYSTKSHSKLIISDIENEGQFCTYIGSCNWFTSSFKSYEVSIRLRESKIVKKV